MIVLTFHRYKFKNFSEVDHAHLRFFILKNSFRKRKLVLKGPMSKIYLITLLAFSFKKKFRKLSRKIVSKSKLDT